MEFKLIDFGYQGNGNGGQSNIAAGEKKGSFFSNLGNTISKPFVSKSVNEPSFTANVLTLGHAGSDAPPPPITKAEQSAPTNTSMQGELNAFYGESDGYQPDEDREKPVEVAQTEELSPSVANLAAYQELRRDYSDADIREGAALGLSNERMLETSRDGKGLIPEDVLQQQQFAELLQHKDALEFQQAMSMNGGLPENGAQASWAGAKSAAASIQLAYS